MLKKNNSIGSAQVIIITAIVVVLAGAVGYLGWNAYQGKYGASTASTISETSKTTDTNTPSETANTQTETNVVKLDSWGVKFTIVESLAGTQVKYKAETQDRQTTAYVFTTARVEALGGECAKAPFGDLVSLIRFAEKPIATPDSELVSESPIGGYYYVVSGPIKSCSESDVVSLDRAAIKESLKSLIATN